MIFTSKAMTLNIKNALAYLTFNRFESIPFIQHAFSTRLGGVSSGEFTSMNMSFNRGDDDANVTENYKRLCSAIGIEYENLVASAQDHHTYIRRVSSADKGIGIYRPRDMESVDALITNEPDVALVTYFADCTPLMFIDMSGKAIGAAHAGWRGTVGRIGEKTVFEMQKEFGTNPKNVLASIGPAINKCCYEVDEPVAYQFEKLDLNSKQFIIPKDNGKFMIDLIEANRQILLSCGIKEDNIVTSDICTRCSHDLIWSHRATNGRRGGMCGIIQICK